MDIPKQTSAIMYVWSHAGKEAWQCSECLSIDIGKAPTTCPECQRPVQANVVYGRCDETV